MINHNKYNYHHLESQKGHQKHSHVHSPVIHLWQNKYPFHNSQSKCRMLNAHLSLERIDMNYNYHYPFYLPNCHKRTNKQNLVHKYQNCNGHFLAHQQEYQFHQNSKDDCPSQILGINFHNGHHNEVYLQAFEQQCNYHCLVYQSMHQNPNNSQILDHKVYIGSYHFLAYLIIIPIHKHLHLVLMSLQCNYHFHACLLKYQCRNILCLANNFLLYTSHVHHSQLAYQYPKIHLLDRSFHLDKYHCQKNQEPQRTSSASAFGYINYRKYQAHNYKNHLHYNLLQKCNPLFYFLD